MFSLIPGYLLQKRIIGDVDPAWYADAMDALLRISRYLLMATSRRARDERFVRP
jgi:hypothetical protein